jgi:hypothetical protein
MGAVASLFAVDASPVDLHRLVTWEEGPGALLARVEDLHLRRVLTAVRRAEVAGVAGVAVAPWLGLAPDDARLLARGPVATSLVHRLGRGSETDRSDALALLAALPTAVGDGPAPRWRGEPLPIDVARPGRLGLGTAGPFWGWALDDVLEGFPGLAAPPAPPDPGIVAEALALVDDVVPAAAPEIGTVLTHIVAIDPALETTGATLHGTRGASWLAVRHPVELALTLVHETGHQVVASLLDLWTLADDQSAPVVSIYGAPRPAYGVVHAAVSFARESRMAAALLDRGVTRSGHWLIPEMEAYAEEIGRLARRAVAILEAEVVLTAEGGEVLAGVADLLAGTVRP